MTRGAPKEVKRRILRGFVLLVFLVLSAIVTGILGGKLVMLLIVFTFLMGSFLLARRALGR